MTHATALSLRTVFGGKFLKPRKPLFSDAATLDNVQKYFTPPLDKPTSSELDHAIRLVYYVRGEKNDLPLEQARKTLGFIKLVVDQIFETRTITFEERFTGDRQERLGIQRAGDYTTLKQANLIKDLFPAHETEPTNSEIDQAVRMIYDVRKHFAHLSLSQAWRKSEFQEMVINYVLSHRMKKGE